MNDGIYSKKAKNTDIKYIKGVGPARALLLGKLGIYTAADLLCYYPRDYIDFSLGHSISRAILGETCPITASVVSTPAFIPTSNKAIKLYKVLVRDEEDKFATLVFFNNEYTAKSLQEGKKYCFIGKLTHSLTGFEILSPRFHALEEGASHITAVYGQTQGLNSNIIAKAVENAVHLCIEDIVEPIPDPIRKNFGLCTLQFAIQNIHYPRDMENLELAKQRIAFGELLTFSLAMRKIKSTIKQAVTRPIVCQDLSIFYQNLPFTPTQAQSNAIEAILKDMACSHPMSRLLQGDVGSGKTAVCAAACFATMQNGRQAALMAPTELLANQHFHSLCKLLPTEKEKIALLTGSTKPAVRRDILSALANGQIRLLIGTHALFSEDVVYQDLALVVTDEQHRFGVNHRALLSSKGNQPHMLVMSATPIPRTLALSLYGDLDVSILDGIPTGRKPIKTYLYRDETPERLFGFIKKELDAGHQAYIVCPAIDESENERAAVTEYFKPVSTYFKNEECAMLYGKMPSEQKNSTHLRFAAGEIKVLVSTTVIEVGIDVPNATVIAIENAECFGLAQLHQLRGRVGRGSAQSFCVLCSKVRSDSSLSRLKILTASSDGFVIADEDLRLRGPGDFLGKRQSGVFSFKMVSAFKDTALIDAARYAAEQLYEEIPREIEEEINEMIEELGSRLN